MSWHGRTLWRLIYCPGHLESLELGIMTIEEYGNTSKLFCVQAVFFLGWLYQVSSNFGGIISKLYFACVV